MSSQVDLLALLARWPAPACDDDEWDGRADATLRAALAAKGAPDGFEALFEAPTLEAVDGEPTLTPAVAGTEQWVGSGENNMSRFDGGPESPPNAPSPAVTESVASHDGGPESLPQAPSSMAAESVPSSSLGASEAPRAKKTSLREIAARASQAGGRASIPGMATPIPGSVRASVRPPSSAGSLSTPMPSRAAPKPEKSEEDSGIVDLNAVREAAAAKEQEKAAAVAAAAVPLEVKSAPGGETTAETAVAQPKRPAAQAKPAAEPKGGSNGAMAGVAIAVIGLAAAFFIVQRGKALPPVPAPHGPGVETAAIQVLAPAQATGQAAEVAAAAAADTGAAAGTGAAAEDNAPRPLGGPWPSGSVVADKGAPGGPRVPGAAAPLPAGSAKPGDLAGAMAQAVGGEQGAKASGGETPQPAAGTKNQNIPEQPSQGKVQAAVGSVMGGAKGCVAGAEDVSRAQITFGSSGAVSNVSVTGWAAANGKSSCIKSALKGASVGPFAKPSFTVGVTIRP